ncbi:hypothetical protein HDU98_002603 [Podochytrium sp. JEL0797]|nr:hypothetical protein HDU98_002603 [Podochytrium sp. JEL0797]
MSKLEKLEGSLMPNFDGLLELEGLSTDLAEALPSIDGHGNQARRAVLIMNEYTPDEVCAAMETFGIAAPLRQLGLGGLVLQVDTSGEFVQRVTLSAVDLVKDALPELAAATGAPPPFYTIVLSRKGKGGFPVGADNFLCDLFVRRRFMAFENLKCYQEIMQILPPEVSALAALSQRITQFAVSVATEVIHAFEPPSRHEALENNSARNTVMRGLPATAPTSFQHEFAIDDGRTARILYDFMSQNLPEQMSVTIIEWLALQNPLLEFKPSRPRLPGQHHPGLGVARQVTQMLVHMCEDKKRDCLVSSPEYFHNAAVYRLAGWRFLNPAFEGYLVALLDDLKVDLEEKGLSAVGWAFQNCHVVNADGVVEVWQMQEQYLPVSDRMKAYADSAEYTRLVERFARRYRGKLHIDWDNALELQKYIVPNPRQVATPTLSTTSANGSESPAAEL